MAHMLRSGYYSNRTVAADKTKLFLSTISVTIWYSFRAKLGQSFLSREDFHMALHTVLPICQYDVQQVQQRELPCSIELVGRSMLVLHPMATTQNVCFYNISLIIQKLFGEETFGANVCQKIEPKFFVSDSLPFGKAYRGLYHVNIICRKYSNAWSGVHYRLYRVECWLYSRCWRNKKSTCSMRALQCRILLEVKTRPEYFFKILGLTVFHRTGCHMARIQAVLHTTCCWFVRKSVIG